MKNLKLNTFLGLLFITLATISSCNKDGKDDFNGEYTGTNKAYITAENNNVLNIEEKDQIVNAKISLTRKLKETTTFELTSIGKDGIPADMLNISPEKVTINAGSKECTFKITLKENTVLDKKNRIKISIKENSLIEVAEELEIVVKPAAEIIPILYNQDSLLEGYKAKGMDIRQFLGKIKVKTTVFNPANSSLADFVQEFTRTWEGFSVISLSELSTPDQPVLKMNDNPMGMTEFFYLLLRKETIENDEFWFDPGAGPDYAKVMDLISWNKDSEETFGVTLDSIKINSDKSIDYLGKILDPCGYPINTVPFEWSYTAWDRLKKLIDDGNPDAAEYHLHNATPYPPRFINTTDILVDEYETGEFKENSGRGTIDYENGTMSFEFQTSFYDGGDYLQVKAEYITK